LFDEELQIEPGDSVIVIGKDGKIRKLVMPEFRNQMEHNAGTEKVLEVLQLFDPDAKIETFSLEERKKLN